jgi:hypothetical protein
VGSLATFRDIVLKRYGDGEEEDDVIVWTTRPYSHWTGSYLGYRGPDLLRL